MVFMQDSEKITINLGHVDLGRIDLLVQEGFYSNRSDFIRTAIRNQLTAQGDAVARSIERHTLELGLRDRCAAEGERGAQGETKGFHSLTPDRGSGQAARDRVADSDGPPRKCGGKPDSVPLRQSDGHVATMRAPFGLPDTEFAP